MVAFNPFSGPLEGRLLEQVSNGIDKVEGVLRWVRNKPRVKDAKNRLVIASNMDRTGGDLVEGADEASQEDDAIHAGEFTAVGVAIPNRARDRMDSTDGVVIRGTYEDEGGSTTLGRVKGGIADSEAGVRGDGCGNVGCSGGSFHIGESPSFVVGESSDMVI